VIGHAYAWNIAVDSFFTMCVATRAGKKINKKLGFWVLTYKCQTQPT